MALDYDELFALEPFGLAQAEKDALFARWLPELQAHHVAACPAYARMVDVLGDNSAVPVRLFKEFDLRSVGQGDMVKTMMSSGTTGRARSRVYLDRGTSARQSRALSRIVVDFLGTRSRVPMLVIDAEGTVRNRDMLSARAAGIRGFSMFGRDVTFALADDMELDFEVVSAFAKRHTGERVMLFGFTSVVWSHFVEPMRERGLSLELDGLLVHGGGWKKLADRAVSAAEFKEGCQEVLGRGVRVSDYYGMVEQMGSIFMECECGHLHASVFGDVEVVDPLTLAPVGIGERGLVKAVSLLPTSYPGHVVLTEDVGAILGVDDCPCGHKGKYFEVYGRQEGAEVRGCSDAYGRVGASFESVSVGGSECAPSGCSREDGLDSGRVGEDVQESRSSVCRGSAGRVGSCLSNVDLRPVLVAGSASAVFASPCGTFDPRDVALLADVASRLMRDSAARSFPDVASFAFWCRKGRLGALVEERTDLASNMGRGLAFHVTPSNAPVSFAFSWAFSLLAGNANVVRVPSRPYTQVDIICKAIDEAMRDAGDERTAFVRYPADSSLTEELSAVADVRVIWGGDDTVSRVRGMASKPRCIDVTFADRHGIAVVDVEAVLALDEAGLAQLARDFYNDAYLMDQGACSSPTAVVWLGASDEGRSRFWSAVREIAADRYLLQEPVVTDKYVQLCCDAVEGRACGPLAFDGLLQRVPVAIGDVPDGGLGAYRGRGGYFYEVEVGGFDEVIPRLDASCQTVTYFGCNPCEIRRVVVESGCRGVDRVVPVGRAFDIDSVWDGMDLLSMMSRRVDVR